MGSRRWHLSWDRLYYECFKKDFPNSYKQTYLRKPYGYMSLEIWLKDGRVFIYDGFNKTLKDTGKRWDDGYKSRGVKNRGKRKTE